MSLPRLLVLTDRSQLRLGRPLASTLAECVAAGATHVVVRELDEPAAARTALVDAVVKAGGVAIAAHSALPGAVGVHLPLPDFARTGAASSQPSAGEHAMTPRYRNDGGTAGPEQMSERGASCHGAADVREAAELGATYATLSPYAPTPSKPGYGPALAAEQFAGHPIPVFALGGITPENAREALAAGAYGVAVMGAVMRAADPAAVVRELVEAVG